MRALIQDIDYFVRFVPLPYSIRGACTRNGDGTYNIFINARLNQPLQQDTFLHELVHCEKGHLDYRSDIPEEIKETEAGAEAPVIRFIC